MRKSFEVVGCELTEVKGWGNAITYAVGCGLESDGEIEGDASKDCLGDPKLECMSMVGWRSQTMSILSSLKDEMGKL
jgi:hypothetical protein